MALSRADLGETEHVLTRNALRLLIRSHSQITLLHGSLDSCDLEEVVTGGLWITRGNGLNLAVRLNLGACAGPDFQLENFAEGLVDILSTAEVIPPVACTDCFS